MAPPHPRWYSIYKRCIDVAWLTEKIVRHANELSVLAKQARAIEEEERQREILRFEEVLHENDDDDSVSSADSLATDAPFHDHLDSGASRVFRTPRCRPKQQQSVYTICCDPKSKGRLLVVDRTGGGKSLILYLTAIVVSGITLVIVPLLALTANQLSRIRAAVQKHGTIEAHHIDETSPADLKEKVIPRMDGLATGGSTFLLLLCSPQEIAENKPFRDALLRARRNRTLRLVAIDEAHLYAMHGRSFRESIRVLRDIFFSILFNPRIDYSPLFLAMTATMPLSLLNTFSELTHVDWSLPCHQLWSNHYEFRRRYIKINMEVRGEFSLYGIPELVALLAKDSTSHACVFVNFKTECVQWAGVIEEKIRAKFLKAHVVQINGDMDKHEKFAYIRLFTTSVRLKGYYPRVLMATGAGNTGIEQMLVVMVLRLGLPRCMTTLLQELGRNSREEGLPGLFNLCFDWKALVFLLLSILVPPKDTADEVNDHDYANSMITAMTPENRRARKSKGKKKASAPLSSTEKHNNVVQAYNDLMEVIYFLFTPALGCLHLRSEWFLATGRMEPVPDVWDHAFMGCGSQCFVCNGYYKTYMLPIVHKEAVRFLGSKYFQSKMDFEITRDNPDGLPGILWQSGWEDSIFAKSVCRYNVNAFFFQLVATKILSFEWSGTKGVVCVLTRDSEDNFRYLSAGAWEGFTFRSPERGNNLIPFSSITQMNIKRTDTESEK